MLRLASRATITRLYVPESVERSAVPASSGTDITREFHEIGVTTSLRSYGRRLWRRRDFIVLAPMGQLRAQTNNTLLGGLWHLLNPTLTAALYYFIFGFLLNVGRGIDNYAAFLTIGMFTFLFTIRVVMAGARSITGNRGLLTQINLPRAALPLSATLAECLSHGFAVLALLVTVVILGEPPSLAWLTVPVIVALHAVFNLGLAFFVARLSFHFRDVQELLPHVTRFWLYLSGLFFTVETVTAAVGEGALSLLFALNPGYVFIQLMRAALMDDYTVTLGLWASAVLWSVATLIGGFVFFHRREQEYGIV
jgi:teichoic acid transport system permease protein